VIEELVSSVRQGNAILFAGAGVSMNLGLPSWSRLIVHMAEELGYDPDIFSGLGDYLALAEYYLGVKGSLEPLRHWMQTAWHRPDIDIGASDVHRLLVKLPFPIVYTTNYDAWLEEGFNYYGKKFVKIVRVADLVRVRPDAVQVVKFHGDFEDETSFVLTESSFFERLSFEGPLDIKLRADTLSRPVLFIGYSLSDVNTRYLLYKLERLWASSADAAARPPSFIFLDRPNPVQEAVLRRRGIVPIVSECDEPGAGLQRFLEQLAAAV
jgi:hypothetical protein